MPFYNITQLRNTCAEWVTHSEILSEVEMRNEFSPIAFTLLTDRQVQSIQKHLFNESNIRNPGYFVFANTSASWTYGTSIIITLKCL